MIKAVWSERYGWHLREETMKENSGNCKNCEHGCHCSNGGSCTSCECKNCEHTSYEANNA
jgi:hypothetical protein